MEEQSIEQLLSVIELQRNALLYYSDNKNYENDSIKKDMGSLAKFTLKQAKDVLDYNKNLTTILENLNLKEQGFDVDELKKTMNDLNKLDMTIDQINKIIENEKKDV